MAEVASISSMKIVLTVETNHLTSAAEFCCMKLPEGNSAECICAVQIPIFFEMLHDLLMGYGNLGEPGRNRSAVIAGTTWLCFQCFSPTAGSVCIMHLVAGFVRIRTSDARAMRCQMTPVQRNDSFVKA